MSNEVDCRKCLYFKVGYVMNICMLGFVYEEEIDLLKSKNKINKTINPVKLNEENKNCIHFKSKE